MKKRSYKLVVLLTAVLLAFGLAAAGCGDKEGKDLTALAQPTSLSYSDGTLSWDAVTGAENGYSVKVTKGSETVVDKTVTETSVTLENPAAGDYSASVTALAVKDKFLASASATLTFTVAPAPAEKTKLAAPAPAYNQAAQTITWAAVENAVGYKVSAVKTGTDEVTIAEKTVSQPTLSVEGLSTDKHTVTVISLAGDSASYVDSDAAAFNLTILTNPLEAVSDITFTAGADTLTWDEVMGADAYDVIIKQSGNKVEGKEVFTGSYDTSKLGKGTFTAEIKVYAPEGSIYYTDSEVATTEFTIESLGELSAPQNVKVESGSVVWDASNARGYDVTVVDKETSQPVEADPIIKGNSLQIAAMGLADGGYTVSVKATSNRHNQTESAAVTQNVWITTAASYNAEAIAKFDGTAPVGEHAAVELVTVGGKQYARVSPTADGWGRVGGPAITLDFDQKPVVFMNMGEVLGGYHLQIQYGINNYMALKDSLITESSVVDLVKGLKNEGNLPISGIKTVRLRLGVDHSVSNAENDARANYEGVTVMYVTDHSMGLDVETKLDAPVLAVSDAGQLTWQGIAHANAYELVIKNTETQETVFNEVITVTERNLYDLPDGHYEASVIAKHMTDPNALPSDAATVGFTVSTAANYSPQNMDTTTGTFEPGANNLQATYNSETGFVTLNSAAEPAGHGWIYPKAGLDLNFNYNPIITVTIESGTAGGYLARAKYDGSTGEVVMKNDTPGAITSKTVVAMRAAFNVDGNSLGTGTKTNYKFGMGVTGNGVLQLSGMKITYVYQDEDLTRPETPVKLDAPQNLKLNEAKISADAVKGNSVYAPLYNVTVTEKESGTKVGEATALQNPEYVLGNFDLENGKIYTVSMVAVGDNDEAKPYFSDSDAATLDIKYTQIMAVTDFTSLAGVKRMGDNVRVTKQDAAGLTISIPKGQWGIMQFPIIVDKSAVTAASVFEVHFGATVGSPEFASRYFVDGDVANEAKGFAMDFIGDQGVSANTVLYDAGNLHKNATYVEIGGQQGFYIGLGHGGGGGTEDSAVKEFTITKLVIAEYSVVA